MKLHHFIFTGFKTFKSKSGFVSFNYYLSILLIAFSLTAIILTDSFTDGYKKELLSRVKSLNPDYKVTSKLYSYISQADFDVFKSNVDTSHFYFVPYMETAGVIVSKATKNGIAYSQREEVYLQGINFNLVPDRLPLKNFLQNNNFNVKENEIIIGKYLSERISKYINDKVIILFYDNKEKTFIGNNFTIKDIYDTGTQADEYLVYTSISSIRNNQNSYYSDGIYVYQNNDNKNIDFNYTNPIFNVEKLSYDNLVNFLNSFDLPIKFLMWIILFLSFYSLSTLIYSFIIDKKNDLKILYILGCSYNDLRTLMIILSAYISLIGIFIGSVTAILCIYIQNNFEIISLPSRKIFQISILKGDVNFQYFIFYPILILIFSSILSFFIFNKNIGQIKND